MGIGSFKEVMDIPQKRFADSPLGRLSEGKIFDKPMSYYDSPLTVDEKIKNCPIEGHGGHWEGERGESKWYPNRSDIPKKNNPKNETWNEILDKYSIDGIPFIDGEPDFREISKGTVKIEGFSADRTDNFDKADIELAKQKSCPPEDISKWRKENGYTWHECKDMKTMQLVPKEIHNNTPHSGGISEYKRGNGE